MDISGISLLEK